MDYVIKPIRFEDDALVEILALLHITFPQASQYHSLDYIKWEYTENPLGLMVGFNAYKNNQLAAHYVAMPIIMNIYGIRRKGLLSLNTATHPEHRGCGLFTILANKTYEYAASQGFEFVIGVGNANSTHGFLKNLGFSFISALDVKIGCGLGIYKRKQAQCWRYWDLAQLKWRMNNPAKKKKYFINHEILMSNMDIPFVKGLLGQIHLNNLEADKTDFLKRLIRPVNLYVGLGADLSRGCYFNVPSFIKHSPFNLIFKDLSGLGLSIRKEDVFFQLIDFDVL